MPPFLRYALPALLVLAAFLVTAVPKVGYDVRVELKSWWPLAPKDVSKTVEHAALEVLSRPGLIGLSKGKSGAADYRLVIRAVLLDEAETHTVYLEIRGDRKSDLPSLNASDTVPLSKKSRAQMLKAIDASARRAAGDLVEALKGPLSQVGQAPEVAPPDNPFAKKRPKWKWAPVRIPKVRTGRAHDELYDKRARLRQEALQELTSLALSEAGPRNTLETCALDHFDKDIRFGCLVALRPLSRRVEPTRRVVVEVFRTSKDSRARREAKAQMLYFSGHARAEVIQALVERASRGEVDSVLKSLGSVPNLDAAIRSCLSKASKSRGRGQSACIELMEPLPYRRRLAILWRFLRESDPDSPFYLKGAGEREGSIGTPWQRAVEAILDKSTRWDPRIGELLWKRYQRTLSASSIRLLAGYAPPSKKHAQRMLEVVQTAGTNHALWSLRRIGKAEAALRPLVVDGLSEMMAMGTYPKSLSKRELERTLKELKK